MPALPKPGRSALFLGPSGGGKSTILRTAMEHAGTGVALLAPGTEEFASFQEFHGREGYVVKPVGDPQFQPMIGMTTASGFRESIQFLNGVYLSGKYHLGLLDEQTAEQFREGMGEPLGKLKYTLLVNDTISGVAVLAVNQMLSVMGMKDAPPAQSPDGARFYGGLKNVMEQYLALLDACKGLGMDLLVTSHVTEKEQKDTAQADKIGNKTWVPLMAGSFRDALPRAFDLVMYCGVDSQKKIGEPLRHYVQWMTEAKRPTKSRVGALSQAGKLPNNWPVLEELYDKALAQRLQA